MATKHVVHTSRYKSQQTIASLRLLAVLSRRTGSMCCFVHCRRKTSGSHSLQLRAWELSRPCPRMSSPTRNGPTGSASCPTSRRYTSTSKRESLVWKVRTRWRKRHCQEYLELTGRQFFCHWFRQSNDVWSDLWKALPDWYTGQSLGKLSALSQSTLEVKQAAHEQQFATCRCVTENAASRGGLLCSTWLAPVSVPYLQSRRFIVAFPTLSGPVYGSCLRLRTVRARTLAAKIWGEWLLWSRSSNSSILCFYTKACWYGKFSTLSLFCLLLLFLFLDE